MNGKKAKKLARLALIEAKNRNYDFSQTNFVAARGGNGGSIFVARPDSPRSIYRKMKKAHHKL